MQFFSQTGTTITCQISNKSWVYTVGNLASKQSAIQAALEYQRSLLTKLASVTGRNYYTIEDLQAAYAAIA